MARFTSTPRKRQLSPSQKRANYLAREERAFLAHLIRLRKESGLTQSEVAKILGVSQQAISKFESIESSPTLSTVITYAHAIDALVHFDVALNEGRFEEFGEDWITSTVRPVGEAPSAEEAPEKPEEFDITPDKFITTPEAEVVAGALQADFTLAARKQSPTEELTDIQREWVGSVAQKATPRLEDLPPYSPEKLHELAGEITSLTKAPSKFQELQKYLDNAGVCLTYVERFPGSKIQGVSFFIDETPVIGLSGHGKRYDKVLFTLLHEISHILNGDVSAEQEVIIHDENSAFGILDQENAADEFASELALKGQRLPSPPRPISKEWIEEQAESLEIHPLIIIGRLQKEKLLRWDTTLVKGAPTVAEYLEQWD